MPSKKVIGAPDGFTGWGSLRLTAEELKFLKAKMGLLQLKASPFLRALVKEYIYSEMGKPEKLPYGHTVLINKQK